jgi:hypothetical protein
VRAVWIYNTATGRNVTISASMKDFLIPVVTHKHYRIVDLSPQVFRRAYIAALFAEDEGWLTAIGKYQMLVQGKSERLMNVLKI